MFLYNKQTEKASIAEARQVAREWQFAQPTAVEQSRTYYCGMNAYGEQRGMAFRG